MVDTIVYTLDRDNRILDVQGNWSEFANRNDGAGISDPSVVLGRNLMDFMSGSEMQSFFGQILDNVRITWRPAALLYRCDAPDQRRYMRVEVTPGTQKKVTVRNTVLAEEARERVDALQTAGERNSDIVEFCSVCRRVHVPETGWMEPDTVAARTRLFIEHRRPQIRERVCPDCEQLTEGCEYLVTARDDLSGPQPVVLFLHGARQGQNLMRMFAPPRLSAGEQGHDFLLVSPVLRDRETWDLAKIDVIVAEVLARYEVDPDRFYVTGVSSGAISAWQWIMNTDVVRPAAFISVSAMLTIPSIPTALKKTESLPILSIYGSKDPIISPKIMETWANSMKERNKNVELTCIDRAEHDVWSRAFADNEIWDWLFSKRAKQPNDATPYP